MLIDIYFQKIFKKIDFISNFKNVFRIFMSSNAIKCVFCTTNFQFGYEILHHFHGKINNHHIEQTISNIHYYYIKNFKYTVNLTLSIKETF